MLLTFKLTFRYTVTFSYDYNKFCWNRLKTLGVSDAYATVGKNISFKFVLNGICFS